MLPLVRCRPRRIALPAVFLSFMAAAALILRLAAATGELWLDEIWSLEWAVTVHSPLELLTRIRHDNHHPLNTLWLWLLGPTRPLIVYRLPAVICGTLAVVCGGLVAARCGRIAALTAITLLSSSSLLVHYSSEARGYAFLLLAVAAGAELLLRLAASTDWQTRIAFWSCCLFGFLSHPLFVHFWLAGALWRVATSLEGANRAAACRRTLLDQSVPVAIAFCLWIVQWRGMELGGGPPYVLHEQLIAAASAALGGPLSGWIAGLVAAGFVIASVGGCGLLQDQRIGLFWLAAMVLPLLHILAARPPFLFVRYFLVSIYFGLLAVAVMLATIYHSGRSGRIVYACLLSAFLVANTWHTLQLVRTGRGQCRAALAYMAAATPAEVVTISSDHNFGIRKLVDFYALRVQPRQKFQYVDGDKWPPAGPQWLVLRPGVIPGQQLEAEMLIDGHTFRLERTFDCSPLSGWRWACYRKLSTSSDAGNSP